MIHFQSTDSDYNESETPDFKGGCSFFNGMYIVEWWCCSDTLGTVYMLIDVFDE